MFCQNFLNEKLVPGTYFIGKCIPPTLYVQFVLETEFNSGTAVFAFLFSEEYEKIFGYLSDKKYQ
jgi:hypothetical protein